MTQLVHLKVRDVAMEMAGEFYEAAAHDNLFYKMYPNVRFFIHKEWKRFIKPARTVMAQMLGGNYPEKTKEEIFQALLLDKTLPQGNGTAITPVTMH